MRRNKVDMLQTNSKQTVKQLKMLQRNQSLI